MRSIPTIFCFDKETHTVVDRKLKLVDWVFQGKGVATRKYDGVAIKVEHGKVYRRFEWREGTDKVPTSFQKLQDFDPKRPQAPIPGWVPVPHTFLTAPDGTDELCLKEAWEEAMKSSLEIAKAEAFKTAANIWHGLSTSPMLAAVVVKVPDGTYELCGPKIHGNNEKFKSHVLLQHGVDVVKGVPRNYDKLKIFLETYEGEGIVWHHKENGVTLMAKIKRRDFGFNTRISHADVVMAYREEKKEEVAIET